MQHKYLTTTGLVTKYVQDVIKTQKAKFCVRPSVLAVQQDGNICYSSVEHRLRPFREKCQTEGNQLLKSLFLFYECVRAFVLGVSHDMVLCTFHSYPGDVPTVLSSLHFPQTGINMTEGCFKFCLEKPRLVVVKISVGQKTTQDYLSRLSLLLFD